MNKCFKRMITASAGILLAAAPIVGYAADPVAKVGESEITQETFYNEMKASAGEAVLNELILQLAFEQHLDNTEELRKQVDEEVDAQIEEAGGEDQFATLLAYQQLGSIESYKNTLYTQYMAEEAVKQSLDTSEESLKKFYDEEYAAKMEARHILVETKKEAKAVIKRLNDGEDFAEVAKDVSTDPSAADGGMLPPFQEGDMVEPFEKAVKAAENGDVSQKPVKTDFGYHVIETIQNGEKPSFDDVKDSLVDEMANAKLTDAQAIQELFDQILRDADIEIYDKDLKHLIDFIFVDEDVEAEETDDASELDLEQIESTEE